MYSNIGPNNGGDKRKVLVETRKREQMVTKKLVDDTRVELLTKAFAELKVG